MLISKKICPSFLPSSERYLPVPVVRNIPQFGFFISARVILVAPKVSLPVQHSVADDQRPGEGAPEPGHRAVEIDQLPLVRVEVERVHSFNTRHQVPNCA